MNLKSLLVLFTTLLLIGGAVHLAKADEVTVIKTYTSDAGDVLALSDAPCTTMKGAFIGVPLTDRSPNLKAAKLMWQGQALDACWIKAPTGETLVIDETGDAGAVEGSIFEPAPSKGAAI